MEEVNIIVESTKDSMSNSIEHLKKELLKIRAGKSSPSMVSSIMVDYYGSQTPLSQVANVSTPDSSTINIQPWEKNLISEIEKALINSNLGLNPSNNGDFVILSIPPLTEERRKELVKQTKSEAEVAKVSIRTARKEGNSEVNKVDGISEDLIKNTESSIQDLTNDYSKKVDTIISEKEKEIMTV